MMKASQLQRWRRAWGLAVGGLMVGAGFVWDGGSELDSRWSTATNWVDDTLPVSAADTTIVIAGDARLSDQQQDRANPFQLNRLEFQHAAAFSLTNGSPLQFAGVDAALVQDSTSTVAITLPMQLAAPLAVQGAGGGTVTLGGVLGGASGFTKQGAFTLRLQGNGANAYGGNVAVLEGTLELSKSVNGAKAIPDGRTLTIGGTDTNAPAAVVRYGAGVGNDQIGNGPIVIHANGVLDFNGATDTVANDASTPVALYGSAAGQGLITNSAAGGEWSTAFNAPLQFHGGGRVDSGTGLLKVNQGGIQYGLDGPAGAMAAIAGRLDMGGNSTFPVTVADDPALLPELTIAATIANGGLYKQGPGALLLAGTNTYTGSTLVRGGTLLVGSDAPAASPGALGQSGSDVNLADGASPPGAHIALGTFGPVVIGRNMLLKNNNAGGVSTLGGYSAHVSTFAGGVTFDNPDVRNQFTAAAGGTVGFTGNISGGHAVTKVGPGTVVYSGADKTYSGRTTISNGTLQVNNTLGASAVTVTTNGTLGGVGTCGAGVTVTAGGQVAPGAGGVGTLTASTLTLLSGATLAFEFNGAPTNDQIVATMADGLTVSNAVGVLLYREGDATQPWLQNGTYKLIQYAGTLQGDGISSFSVANPHPYFSYTFATNSPWVTVTIAGSSGLLTVVK